MAQPAMMTAGQTVARRLAERMVARRAGRIGLHIVALVVDRELRWHAAGIARELAATWLNLRARRRLLRRRLASA